VPLGWRGRSAEARSIWCAFLAAAGLFFGIGALTICLFWAACMRYEVEFLPALVLLAVIGILSLERVTSQGSLQRRAMRWSCGFLLVFSVVFNLLASVERCAEAHNNLAVALAKAGQTPEAISHWERALRLKPDYAKVDYNWGVALAKAGQMQEAISHWEQALRIKPDYAEAHFNLGIALARAGQMQEAISHWEQALRIKPDYAEAHYNLGLALEQSGDTLGAIAHYEQALRLKPDLTEARGSLARLQATVK
jgi:tetratricopeptide (TPR) repeat protein